MSDKNYIKTILHNFTRHETSEETRQKFRQWITDPKDRKAKDEALGNLWDETQAPYSFADEKGWQRLSAEIAAGQRRSRMRMWRRAVLGAVAVLVAGLFVSQYLLLSNRIERAERDRTLCYVTSQESKGVFTLPDGTSVWLNGNSRLTLSEQFDGTQRRVKLEGEGFFDVTPNPDKPFIIRSGEARVKVLGTSFDFKSYKEDEFIKLTVSTGKVRVNVADQDLQLAVSPNEHLSINKIDGNVRKESIEENNYIKWIHGSLYFNKEPIREVIKTINRTYNRKVILQCKNCDYRITGTHDNKSIEAVIEAICFTTGLRSKREGGNIILYEKH